MSRCMWFTSKQNGSSHVLLFVLFFFFQAEDGIRDIGVTGVQTCALPIFRRLQVGHPVAEDGEAAEGRRVERLEDDPVAAHRSEERRVGKECRSQEATDAVKRVLSQYL